MKKILSVILNVLFRFQKVDSQKIIFETGNDKVEGNPLAIYEYIKNNCPNDFKTIWFVKKNMDVSKLDPLDVVYYRTWKYFKHLSSARYWIRSHSVGSLLKKKPNQIYIQTWHGGGAFKKCGYDIEEQPNLGPKDHVKEWDYYIASDTYNASMIQTSTGYQKEIRVLGLARSDEIVTMKFSQTESIKNAVLNDLSDTKKNIILYAPTFREKDIADNRVQLPIEELGCLDNCIILIRLHPWVKQFINHSQLCENMIDVSGYPNVQDLLLISDCLITDYSSIIFDYALLNRPMLFYVYDYDEYMKERTGFYLDFKTELPGLSVRTQQELIEHLKDLTKLKTSSKHKLDIFNKKYNSLNDGNVCERIVSFLKELNQGGTYE